MSTRDPMSENQTTEPDSSGASTCSLSDLLDQLAEQWERRVVAAEALTRDAEATGNHEARARCHVKACTIRSMVIELKRVIREANVQVEGSADNATPQHQKGN